MMHLSSSSSRFSQIWMLLIELTHTLANFLKNLLLLFLLGIHSFACSAYIISPGIRSDNALMNIEKPSIIRNDTIKNDNFSVSVFIPKEEDLEETFFDQNNFSAENESIKKFLPTLWERAKETKNVVLVQLEVTKHIDSIKQVKSIRAKLSSCESIQSVSYQYNFIRFTRPRSGARSRITYPKIPESAYREEMEPVAANVLMKEIPTLRSIFIFSKECILDSKSILSVTVETDEILVFRFKEVK